MHGSGTPRTARSLSSVGAGSGRSTRTRFVSIKGDTRTGILSVLDAAAGNTRSVTGTRTPTRYASVNGRRPLLGERRIPTHTESGTRGTSRSSVPGVAKTRVGAGDSRRSGCRRVGFIGSMRRNDGHMTPQQTSTLLGVAVLLNVARSQRRQWTGSASISPRRLQSAGELY